jgi:hypothetical protein
LAKQLRGDVRNRFYAADLVPPLSAAKLRARNPEIADSSADADCFPPEARKKSWDVAA